MKKIVVYLFAAVLVLLGLYRLTMGNNQPDSNVPADVVLFWGNGCPHCEVVKDYINKNGIDKKLKISQKEVYYDKTNQKLMQEAATKCKLDTSQGLGVPFAVIDEKCIVGDTQIIDTINQKLSNN